MISYAQNGEDVVLARLFDRQPHGRYVDVGASDPVDSSVTKHFYDRGWRGVNIEPVPAMADALAAARPDDVTLPVAVGAEPARVVLHVVGQESGWSTLDDSLAEGYEQDQHWTVQDVDVEMVTLATVLDEHPGHVDFLKIDVEGAERAVIQGADWSRHRPRVVVVEATRPGSSVPSFHEWEPLLLAAGYRCVLFDGLNRFYADADDEEARDCLAAPASVLDGFAHYTRKLETNARAATTAYAHRLETTLHDAQSARERDAEYLKKLEADIDSANGRVSEADRYVASLELRIAELEAGAGAATPAPGPLPTTRSSAVDQRPEDPAALVRRVNAAGGDYHRLDMGSGLLVNGIYDMTRYLPSFHLPERMDGLRVLDVGTASGFFALECHRRGGQVTAIDVRHDRLLPQLIAAFDLPIDFAVQDVHQITAAFGEFDLVVCGTLLLHLADPLGALRALRTVTAGRLVISTTATPDSDTSDVPDLQFFGERAADGDYWSYWGISATALRRMALAAGFARVDHVTHFDIEPEAGFSGAAGRQVVLSAYV